MKSSIYHVVQWLGEAHRYSDERVVSDRSERPNVDDVDTESLSNEAQEFLVHQTH
jgi:hypothetical protein